MLGAIDAISKQIVTICNETYVNAETVNALLDKLVIMRDLPITLVPDNARYQRCNFVMEHARKLGVELLFLPSYSPNLNLIERLWKLVKNKCLYNRYYSRFSDFKEAILTCVNKLNTDCQPELESLLTLEFQDIKKKAVGLNKYTRGTAFCKSQHRENRQHKSQPAMDWLVA